MGVVAPNGIGADRFWRTLLKGQSAIGPITFFDASGFPSRIAGEVHDFVPEEYIDAEFKPSRMARFTQFAVAAARMAIEDARLDPAALQTAAPVPIIMGVSTTAMDVVEEQCQRMRTKGAPSVSALGVPTSFPQAAVNAIAAVFRLNARLLTLSSGCPAGLDAIGLAAEWIRTGRADIALAGGVDTPITPLTLASFAAAKSLSTRNDEPQTASRPFDHARDGGVIAEGAGVVVLESLDHALARGAVAYAEIGGYATQADPYGAEPGSGLGATMETALANAACARESVHYICAHGPSDPVLDRTETACIRAVFGEAAAGIPVSSIKGVTGNPLAAAGPLQVIAAVRAMEHGEIPPTANYGRGDKDCDLDYVPGKPRRRDVRRALVNTHGMGGTNSSLLLQSIEP